MPKTQSRSRRRPSTRARAPRRNETTQPTPPAAEPTGESSSGPIREEPPTSGTNYADLSTEVLHLLLAQRNLALSGSRDVLLKRLADHDRIEIPPATTSVAVTPTPQYSPTHFVHWLKTSHHCSVTFWPAKINRRLRYQAHHRYQRVQLHVARRLTAVVPANFSTVYCIATGSPLPAQKARGPNIKG